MKWIVFNDLTKECPVCHKDIDPSKWDIHRIAHYMQALTEKGLV